MSCFASDADAMLGFDDVVLCFDDVVLCFVRRRALLRSSTYFVLFARDLAGLLCDARRRALLRHAKYAASDEVSQFPCFLFVFAFAPSLSLGGGPCLSMPFLVPFSQGDHRRQQEGPGLRLRAFDVPSSTCFWWRCKPSNRKILRASRRFVLPAL